MTVNAVTPPQGRPLPIGARGPWQEPNARFIYKLEPAGEGQGYDTAGLFIVIARDSKRARQMAAAQAGAEGSQVWLKPTHSKITKIGLARKPNASPARERVVAREFFGT